MSINPQKLAKWDSSKDESMTKVFEQTFSIFEKLEASLSVSGAPMGRSAHYDARQTLACIAKVLDGNFTRRAMIQTEDDEQGMIVDVLSCDGALIRKRDDKKGIPLILARVSYHKKGDDPAKTKQIVEAVAKTMGKSGNGVQSIKAGCAEEMELLHKYFKKNKELLSKDFLQRFEKNLPKRFSIIPGSFTTFISPLFTGEMEKVCNACGKPSTSMCSRCKLVRYCSKECQKEDWKKGHKEDCVSKQDCVLSARDSKSYVEIDPAKIPDDIVYGAAISHHQSIALQQREPVDLRTMIKKQPVGKMEVLKVQVQLYSSVYDQSVIYVYSKGKKFEIDIKAEMFTDGFEGYKSLFEFVKEKGDDAGYGCGGVKLFAHGFVTQERKLRILTDKVLPLQKW